MPGVLCPLNPEVNFRAYKRPMVKMLGRLIALYTVMIKGRYYKTQSRKPPLSKVER
jgi:hypothetical protein